MDKDIQAVSSPLETLQSPPILLCKHHCQAPWLENTSSDNGLLWHNPDEKSDQGRKKIQNGYFYEMCRPDPVVL